MKKLLILLFIFALVKEAQAQPNKGSIIATGAIGYHVSNGRTAADSSKTKFHSYLLSPKVGFLVSDKLEIGLFTSLAQNESHVKNQFSSGNTRFGNQETTEKAIGAYLRRYIFLTERLAFTGIGEISYNTYHRKSKYYSNQFGIDYDITESTYEISNFVVAIRPGLSYFLSEKINLNANFSALSYTIYTFDYESYWEGWQGETTTDNSQTDANTLKLDLTSTSFSLGLSYFF